MTELEKGYIAGIIDGEGSICLTKSGKWRHPTIQISSTTYEMLEYVQSIIGGTISKKSENGVNCKQAYAYKIDYQRAIQVLQEPNRPCFLLLPVLLNTSPKMKARHGLFLLPPHPSMH